MNGWFFAGALVGIAVTIAFEVLLAVLFDLPSRGVDLDDPAPGLPASEVIDAHTANVRVLRPGVVVDLRDRESSPLDAGHVTVGQALGVVLLTVAFLAAMALVGAVETAGLT
jgi:hypothetical protein